MVVVRLLLDGLVDLIIAGVYTWVGRRFTARDFSRDVRPAATAFATWWYALALTGLFAGALSLAVAFGMRDLVPARTLLQLASITFVVAMWGLLRYLLFVLTGRLGTGLLLALVYAAYFAIIVYDEAQRLPVGVDATGWRPVLSYANPPLGSMVALTSLLLVVPQGLASLAYLTLAFRVPDRRTRYRVALVAPTIMLWSVSVLFISRPELAPGDASQVISRAFVLLTAGALLLAYGPPAPVERWLARGHA